MNTLVLFQFPFNYFDEIAYFFTHYFLFIVIFVGGGIVFLFWLWMLIDCLKRDFRNSSDKLIWVLVIILLTILGALLYFFIGRKK